jgi:hypothetical protein
MVYADQWKGLSGRIRELMQAGELHAAITQFTRTGQLKGCIADQPGDRWRHSLYRYAGNGIRVGVHESRHSGFTGNNKVFAFSVNGR